VTDDIYIKGCFVFQLLGGKWSISLFPYPTSEVKIHAWALGEDYFSHQKVQVPKMEVRNFLRLSCRWIFPSISLTYNLCRWVPPFQVLEMFGAFSVAITVTTQGVFLWDISGTHDVNGVAGMIGAPKRRTKKKNQTTTTKGVGWRGSHVFQRVGQVFIPFVEQGIYFLIFLTIWRVWDEVWWVVFCIFWGVAIVVLGYARPFDRMVGSTELVFVMGEAYVV